MHIATRSWAGLKPAPTKWLGESMAGLLVEGFRSLGFARENKGCPGRH